MFSKADHLQGIVTNSDPLFEDRSLIQEIKQQGLLLFTWGDR